MRLRTLSIVWCSLMCMLTSAKAHQIQLGLDQGFEVQSNVLKNLTNPSRDGTYRIAPKITLSQPESNFTYDFEYQPRYTAYFRTNGISGLDHILNGRAEYQFNGRDVLRFTTNFIRVRAIRSDSVLDAVGQPLVVASASGKTQRFEANLALDHSFSARTMGTATLTYDRWDYTTRNNVNNQGFGARLDLNYGLLDRLVVGVNTEARYRAFEEVQFAPASFTTVINSNVLASYQITPRLSVQASGGPAGVFTQQSTPSSRFVSQWNAVLADPVNCPVGFGPCGRLWSAAPPPLPASPPPCGTSLGIPVLRTCALFPAPFLTGRVDDLKLILLDPNQTVFGRSDQALTYFVSMSMTQEFSRGSATLSFVRNEDAGSGVGATTILSTVTARVAYSLSDYWRLTLSGAFTRRESISELPFTQISAQQSTVPGAVDALNRPLAEAGLLIAGSFASNLQQDISWFDASATRRLSDHSHLQFRFQYYKQSQAGTTGTISSSFDNFTAGVFYVYEFDPFKF